MKKQYKINLMKPLLSDYLIKYHNLNLSKPFKCFNKKCHSEKMIYNAKYHNCYCPDCHSKYDIFNMVSLDYQINKKVLLSK